MALRSVSDTSSALWWKRWLLQCRRRRRPAAAVAAAPRLGRSWDRARATRRIGCMSCHTPHSSPPTLATRSSRGSPTNSAGTACSASSSFTYGGGPTTVAIAEGARDGPNRSRQHHALARARESPLSVMPSLAHDCGDLRCDRAHPCCVPTCRVAVTGCSAGNALHTESPARHATPRRGR